LSGERGSESDDLLGGNDRQLAPDAMAAEVLVRGEPVRAAAGRADDGPVAASRRLEATLLWRPPICR
jgi:hypothetical protein